MSIKIQKKIASLVDLNNIKIEQEQINFPNFLNKGFAWVIKSKVNNNKRIMYFDNTNEWYYQNTKYNFPPELIFDGLNGLHIYIKLLFNSQF